MRAFGVVAALGWILACSSFEPSAEVPLTPSADGGTPDSAPVAACAVTCSEGQVCRNDACVAGCPEGIVYVAPDGDDAASGCDVKTAKKTLQAALAFARTAVATTREIHACTGLYQEKKLVLDVPVSLLGGFGCSSAKRIDGYGFPTFGATTPTTIESEDAETLVISGQEIGASVRVEGFTLRSLAAVNEPMATVLVREGASPVLSNLRVLGSTGGGGKALSARTFGVRISEEAAPDLDHLSVEGGSGKAVAPAEAGSTGIMLEPSSGAAHIHDSQIHGGTGFGVGLGSVGVLVATGKSLTGANAIERNTITGGAGTTKGGDPTELPVQGLRVGSGPADVFDNVIAAGKGTCLDWVANGCISSAIGGNATGSATVRVERNRVDGGEVSTPNIDAPAGHHAITAIGGTDGVIANNLVLLGRAAPGATKLTEYGIVMRGGTNRRIAHNTIGGGFGNDRRYIDLGTLETGARIENNLLLGTNRATEIGVVVRSCDATSVGSLQGNAFIGFAQGTVGVQKSGPCTGAVVTFETITEVEAGLNGAVAGSASSNTRVAASCGLDDTLPGSCVALGACGGAYPGCVSSVVDFDTPSLGAADFEKNGWGLKPNSAICFAKTRSADIAGLVPLDRSSKKRTPPASVGALEDDAVCP